MGIKSWFCILVYCFFIVDNTCAQYKVTSYQRNDGLPANLTKTTTQDQLGFIWIGTDLGLVRYDGQEFKALSEGLPSLYIKSFFTTRDKQLVAITDQGMVSIISEPDTIGLKPYQPFDNGDSLDTRYPKEAQVTCDGSIWIAEDRRISKVKNNSVSQYEFDTYGVNFLRSEMIWEEGCGEIFVALPSGSFAMLDSDEEDFIPLSMQISSSLNIDRKWLENIQIDFHGMIRSEDGRIIISSNIGVLVFSIDPITKAATLEEWAMRGIASSYALETKDGEIFVCTFNKGLYMAPNLDRMQEAAEVPDIPFRVINFAYLDNDDNIWVNGDGGVALLQKKFFNTVPTPEGFEVYNYSIGEDRQPYLINSRGELHQLSQDKLGRFSWSFKAKGLFPVPSSPLIGEQLRYVIQDGIFYACDKTTGVIWKCDQNGKQAIAVPGLTTPHGLVKQDQSGVLWVNTEKAGAWKRSPDGTVTKIQQPSENPEAILHTLLDRNTSELYFTASQSTNHYLYKYNQETNSLEDISIDIPASLWEIRDDIYFLISDLTTDEKGDIWLSTSIGLLRISNGVIGLVELGGEYANQPVNMALPDGQGGVWIAMNVGLLYYRNGEIQEFNESDGLPTSNIYHEGLMLDEKGYLWVATPTGIAYSQKSVLKITQTPQPIFTDININGAPVRQTAIHDTPYQAYIEVDFTTPSYPSEKIQYRYRLNKQENTSWSKPTLLGELLLPQMEDGQYQLEVQSKQRGSYSWSIPSTLAFDVSNIWYKTWWGILSILLAIGILIWSSIRIYGARLRQKQKELEQLITQRTHKIESQKQQLLEQKENLESLHSNLTQAFNEVQKQKEENERKTENITDSINYASRIQSAILPHKQRLNAILPPHFILYKPRDIVSGDFYWCNSREEGRAILAVADCTGHGVPGAFMSMIGSVLLEQIVFIKGIDRPDIILKELNKSLQQALNQEGATTRDGMDISILVIDKNTNTIELASARGQVVYIKDQAPHRIKGDNRSVGGERAPIDKEYTLHTLPLKEIDAVYLFSDGFQDQFGGPQGKKFMSRNFRNMLQGIYNLPIEEQESHMEFTLKHWMKPQKNGEEFSQIDDILVVGISLMH